MNTVDLIIIGFVGLVALFGLKSGFLKPVSGIGGFILGIIMAMQHHKDLAPLLAQYIDGPKLQTVAAFIIIVLGVAIATRLVGYLVKQLLNALVLGWLDHVAGAVAAGAIAIAIVGTVFYVLSGAGMASKNQAIAQSKLAPEVAKASLLTSSTPWCSSLPEGTVTESGKCTTMMSFAGELVGMDFRKKLDGMLGGQDLDSLVNVVKSSLNGASPSQLASMAKQGVQAATKTAEEAATKAIQEAATKAAEEAAQKAIEEAASTAGAAAQPAQGNAP